MSEKRIKVWVQEFKDRPNLMLQWIDPDTGKRRSESAKTADPETAETARADKEYELNNGLHTEPSKLDWERFRQMFEEEYLAGLRERTREKYNTVLDVFEEIINPTKLRTVTERTVSLFVKGMRERAVPGGKVGLAPMTIKNYLIALKTALAWAVDQKFLPAVPKFPSVRVPKKKPQPIPTESFEKMLDKAPNEFWRTYLLCGWWGGLRLSEAWRLQWEPSDKLPWVDLQGDRIVLPAEFVKADEDQWVPLHPELRKALEALPRTGAEVFPFRSRTGLAYTRGGLSSTVREIAKKAGVRLSMHKLRKGFGCRVAKMVGKSGAAVLHELMRHSSMQVTMDYYANVDDAKHAAIAGLT